MGLMLAALTVTVVPVLALVVLTLWWLLPFRLSFGIVAVCLHQYRRCCLLG